MLSGSFHREPRNIRQHRGPHGSVCALRAPSKPKWGLLVAPGLLNFRKCDMLDMKTDMFDTTKPFSLSSDIYIYIYIYVYMLLFVDPSC